MPAPHAMGRPNYLTDPKGLWSWLSTVDHKRIGIMYLVSVMGFFLVGGIFALLVRLSLLDPTHTGVRAQAAGCRNL